jgi:hypothetical protein
MRIYYIYQFFLKKQNSILYIIKKNKEFQNLKIHYFIYKSMKYKIYLIHCIFKIFILEIN